MCKYTYPSVIGPSRSVLLQMYEKKKKRIWLFSSGWSHGCFPNIIFGDKPPAGYITHISETLFHASFIFYEWVNLFSFTWTSSFYSCFCLAEAPHSKVRRVSRVRLPPLVGNKWVSSRFLRLRLKVWMSILQEALQWKCSRERLWGRTLCILLFM